MTLTIEPLRVALADQQRATAAMADQLQHNLASLGMTQMEPIRIDADLHDYVQACGNTREARIEAFLAHLVRRFPANQPLGPISTAPGNTDDSENA